MAANEQEIQVEGIGNVTVCFNPRAKRISIRLRPLQGVRLVVPPGKSISDSLSFLEKNRNWILQHLPKIIHKEQKFTVFDENTVFKTRAFALKIEKGERSDISLVFKNGQLLVIYPQTIQVNNQGVQEAIRYGIEEALRREAKAFLPGRLAWLAHKHGFRFSGVVIKNLKSRWGSCATSGNINLNLHLMRLPDHLIDYVLLHELCHTKELNHGPHFWHLLDAVCDGKAKSWDSEMKKYQTKIY